MSFQDNPGGIGNLRCSDSDREMVTDVLSRAFADGRITFEEHDDRLNRAYASRTFAELDVLTADLIPPSAGLTPTRSATPNMPERRFTAATPSVGPVLRNSTTVMSTLKPGAPLHVPQETSLVVILGDAKIDLVNATFANEIVRINLNIFMGEVKIRIPDGIHVVSAINNVMGDFKANNPPQGPFSVTVELHGTIVMGDVKVLGPGGRPGKYERFVR